MTLEQFGIIALLIILLGLFTIDRFRIEIVALGGLGVAAATGLVPLDNVFAGFSNAAVITVVEILLIVQALSRTRILDAVAIRIGQSLSHARAIMLVLCAMGAGLSVFMNNIGAFALMLPITISVSKTAGLNLRMLVMPVSFATLLGGLCSIIGTPPNYLVSEFFIAASGPGFSFFDFAYVGVPVALVGLTVIVLWAPLTLKEARNGERDTSRPAGVRRVVTELHPGSARARAETAGALAERLSGAVHTIIRHNQRVFPIRDDTPIEPNDLIVVEAELERLEAEIDQGNVVLAHGDGLLAKRRAEVVVVPQSTLIGSRIGQLEILSSRGIEVLAVSTQNPRIEGRLEDVQLGVGDVILLHGSPEMVKEALDDADALQLWPLSRFEPAKASYWPVAIFLMGVLAAAFTRIEPPIAFGAVVLILSMGRMLDLRTALSDMNWPIILLLAAMIPVGEAMATSGAAAVLAQSLTALLPSMSTPALVAAMFALALAITPFINNATTAVVLAPIALELARTTGTPPQPLLMAVALGASTDFLTPFGHHNNTLAFGIGGYRFGEFLKVGWPLTLASFAAGMMLISLIWS